jgi:hypothetical protein
MGKVRQGFLIMMLAGWFAAAGGAAEPVLDPLYQSVRQARPDGRQLVVAQPFTLERDVFRFDFESGTFYFLTPLEGRTWGAVFVGQGKLKLSPATEDERAHLELMAGKALPEGLGDRFERLVLLFADDTFEELMLQGSLVNGAPSAAADAALGTLDSWQRKDFDRNFKLRVLTDLLNAPQVKAGVFLALFNGQELPPSAAIVDPRGLEAVLPNVGGEDVALWVASDVRGGLWYACDRLGEVKAKRSSSYKPLAQALHYTIDTAIERNEELRGTTTLRLKTTMPVRVLPLELHSTLRVSEAAYRLVGQEGWQALTWVQEREKEDADLALVLPELVAKGTELEVRLTYRGKEVLFDLGDDVYAVLARATWYPTLNLFRDLATYDLTYRIPERNQLVSVGKPVEERQEGSTAVFRFAADVPVRVAGFNYGKFVNVTQTDAVSGVDVAVFANKRGLEFYANQNIDEQIDSAVVDGSTLDVVDIAPRQSSGRRKPEDLAGDVAADGINSLRLFHTFFGPLPFEQVAVTQQLQFDFGQSWPMLVYLPYAAFMTGSARQSVGFSGKGVDQFMQAVGFHEMAHQWWGHHVGWDSYRDVWLSEGFSEFSAALVVQHTEGWNAYANFWANARERILSSAGNVKPAWQIGPISRGSRLESAKSRSAYNAIVYEKGGFVLHMLRMLMFDPSSQQPDARFIAMMRDFTAAHAGKDASTEDFKKVVERHMVPALNAAGDGKIDWFFDQWVYGTEVPVLRQDLKLKKLSGDEYQVTGTVAIEEVSAGFKALVPLYADFGRGRLAMFGRLPFAGSTSRQVDMKVKFPEKPKKIVANARHEVLVRDAK